MRFPLQRDGNLPLYRQIEEHLRQAIQSGALPPGTRLPAVRRLAIDLGVNRLTVETAYARLEADGFVAGRVGSGTYVQPPWPRPAVAPEPPPLWPLWQRRLPEEHRGDGLAAPAAPPEKALPSSFISFSGGRGDPTLFPVEEFRRVLQQMLRRDGSAALEYGDPRGYAPLRATIAHVLAGQGLTVGADDLLITAGSQQGLALTAQLLVRPGDVVLCESPTYAGALDLFRALRLRIVGVPMDEQGMQTAQLEPLLQQHHPRLIYTIPNFHNPTGICLSVARRRHLLELAERYNVPILEDDFVGDLRYEGHAIPALQAFDSAGRVIYVSTFSKMLMPGLRVGFLAARGPVLDCLAGLKRVSDLAASALNQRALEAYVTIGRYQAHLRRSVRLYRGRCHTMMQAAREFLPRSVRFTPPCGGLFLWLQWPGPITAADILPAARAEGVDFAPGVDFFPDRADGDHCMRLNFAMQPEARILEGLRRLSHAWGRCLTL